MDLRKTIISSFEELEDKRLLLEAKLDDVKPKILKLPQMEGKWSVIQVLAHLSNAEFGTLRYIQKKMQGMEGLGHENMISAIRYHLLKWLLISPIRYKMPKQFSEPSNDLSFEQLKDQFAKNRQSIKMLIDSFPRNSLDKLIFKHPLAGRLSLHQAILFMSDHYSHHLKQIDRILQSVVNRGNSEV